jgi:hypothetical protein
MITCAAYVSFGSVPRFANAIPFLPTPVTIHPSESASEHSRDHWEIAALASPVVRETARAQRLLRHSLLIRKGHFAWPWSLELGLTFRIELSKAVSSCLLFAAYTTATPSVHDSDPRALH